MVPFQLSASSTFPITASRAHCHLNGERQSWDGVPRWNDCIFDNNQLTGKLPQLWSDSNSLWSLERVDLFNNQLTGSVDWDARHMPKLENLVLGPGERAKCQLRYPLFSHLPAAMLYSRSL